MLTVESLRARMSSFRELLVALVVFILCVFVSRAAAAGHAGVQVSVAAAEGQPLDPWHRPWRQLSDGSVYSVGENGLDEAAGADDLKVEHVPHPIMLMVPTFRPTPIGLITMFCRFSMTFAALCAAIAGALVTVVFRIPPQRSRSVELGIRLAGALLLFLPVGLGALRIIQATGNRIPAVEVAWVPPVIYILGTLAASSMLFVCLARSWISVSVDGDPFDASDQAGVDSSPRRI